MVSTEFFCVACTSDQGVWWRRLAFTTVFHDQVCKTRTKTQQQCKFNYNDILRGLSPRPRLCRSSFETSQDEQLSRTASLHARKLQRYSQSRTMKYELNLRSDRVAGRASSTSRQNCLPLWREAVWQELGTELQHRNTSLSLNMIHQPVYCTVTVISNELHVCYFPPRLISPTHFIFDDEC